MSSATPTVSIITIFLNAARFLDEAIQSVLAQTYPDWELLLVDDGSTDEGTEIAQRYTRADPGRIRYFEHSGHQNLGMVRSRNLGLILARGRYVALLDADDLWLPMKLQRQVEILGANPTAALLYGASTYWRTWQGKPTGSSEPDITPGVGISADRLYRPPELLHHLYPLREGPAPCVSSLLFRRDVALSFGGTPEIFVGDRQLYEDQALLVKFYLNESVYVSSETWDKYREHEDSCCARVIGAGKYDSVRGFFLNWFADYLRQQGVFNPRIWWHLKRAQLPYHHPHCYRLFQFCGERLQALVKD